MYVYIERYLCMMCMIHIYTYIYIYIIGCTYVRGRTYVRTHARTYVCTPSPPTKSFPTKSP